MVTRLFHLKSTIETNVDPVPLLDVSSAIQILKGPGFSVTVQFSQHQCGGHAQSDDFLAGSGDDWFLSDACYQQKSANRAK